MKYHAVEHIMDQLDIEVFSVSHVGPLEDLEAVYALREKRGDLSGFEPHESFRTRPNKVVEGAKSVIAIAVPYGIKNRKSSGTPRGFISNMAWEFDYHKVVNEKLDQIKEALLQAHPDGRFLTAVDTGPINDRVTAYGAGLGWIGRNQFIIDERVGSGFYIGIVIADFEIEGASSWRLDFESKCGDCRKCQSACPANALTGDYDFHGQRCISTLTQLKRRLTYDERHRIGRNLYGCDICQWACPYNNQVSRIPDEMIRKSKNILEPFELLKHSNKSFKKEFGHMGFAWRGLKVFKRNALIVIGNDKKYQDLEKLKDLLWTLPEDLTTYVLYAMMMIHPMQTMAYLEAQRLDDSKLQVWLDEARDILQWMRYKYRNIGNEEKENWLF